MFLSNIRGVEPPPIADAVNVDFISRNLTPQGFNLIKQKNKDLQGAINITSFTLQKNFITMSTFVLRLDKNQFVCTGYHDGRIVKEKESKYETDIPSILIDIFNSIKLRPEDQPIHFDIQLQIVQNVCSNIQKKTKNYQNFLQEVKTTKEYQNLKQMQKQGYQKIIRDTQTLLNKKEEISSDNNNLIDPLLKIEGQKQTLQTAIMAFEEESSYLSNVKERLKEACETLKANPVELSHNKLNQSSFNDYVSYLTKLKEVELKQKYLIS